MRKIIVGLTNPYPGAEALSPVQNGSAGARLFAMSGLPMSEYRRTFLRTNLFDREDNRSPWQAAQDFKSKLRPGDLVLVLGGEVRRALDLRFVLIHPVVKDGVTYRQIPHPSGKNLFYNDPVNRYLIQELFSCICTTAEPLTETSALGPPSLSG